MCKGCWRRDNASEIPLIRPVPVAGRLPRSHLRRRLAAILAFNGWREQLGWRSRGGHVNVSPIEEITH